MASPLIEVTCQDSTLAVAAIHLWCREGFSTQGDALMAQGPLPGCSLVSKASRSPWPGCCTDLPGSLSAGRSAELPAPAGRASAPALCPPAPGPQQALLAALMVALLAPGLCKGSCGGTFLRPFSPWRAQHRPAQGCAQGPAGTAPTQGLPTDTGRPEAADGAEILGSEAAQALAHAAHSS